MASVKQNNRTLYCGYIPNGQGISIETINLNDISNEDFYRSYIKLRKPVKIINIRKSVFENCLAWNDDYMVQAAGSSNVSVEKRANQCNAMFGTAAPKVTMPYRDFVSELKSGNDKLYLTTQDLDKMNEITNDEDDDSPIGIMGEPLLSLRKDFPLRPELLCNLIPYQVSLWQGFAPNGTSSGLHHDFHDNLYILLRGQKRFRLFPPSSVSLMRTYGEFNIVYPNGLIVYHRKKHNDALSFSIVHVREDGAPKRDVAEARKTKAEQELLEAEEELENASNISNGTELEKLHLKIANCEKEIEAALDEILEYDSACGEEETDNESFTDEDEPSGLLYYETLKADEKKADEILEPVSKKICYNADETLSKTSTNLRIEKSANNDIPDHFSKLILPSDDCEFEKFMATDSNMKNVNYIVCHLEAGEMLYLPASWFHEVTSYSKSSDEKTGHLALNYWAYPPDKNNFEQPYQDNFWLERWNSVKCLYE